MIKIEVGKYYISEYRNELILVLGVSRVAQHTITYVIREAVIGRPDFSRSFFNSNSIFHSSLRPSTRAERILYAWK